MKIGVSTLAFYPQPLTEVLKFVEDLDVGYCEVINEYPHDSLEKELLDSYDLQISVHAPLSDINLASHNQAIRKSSLAQIKNSMDIANNIDSKVVVVHPGYMPILGRKIKDKIFQYNRNSLKECSDYAQDLGVKMCVENMPDIEDLLYKDLEELKNLVLDIDAHMTLDVGHAHNNQFTVEDMLKSPRIEHIHLHDNDGSFDNHNALGSCEKKGGQGLDFESLFKGLKKINYKGILVVEVEHPHEVGESLDYLKSKLRMS
jgi:sugar phosphate isomerase/epimerase